MSIGGIYGLIDPRDGCLSYIGFTYDFHKRYKAHCQLSRLHKNTKKNAWIKCILKQGVRPELEIIEVIGFTGNDELDQQALNEAEAFWIASFRVVGAQLKNHNATLGGEGGFTGLHTEEAKSKMRGPRSPLSEETKQKMRKPKSDSHRANIAAAQQEMVRSYRNKSMPWNKGMKKP